MTAPRVDAESVKAEAVRLWRIVGHPRDSWTDSPPPGRPANPTMNPRVEYVARKKADDDALVAALARVEAENKGLRLILSCEKAYDRWRAARGTSAQAERLEEFYAHVRAMNADPEMIEHWRDWLDVERDAALAGKAGK